MGFYHQIVCVFRFKFSHHPILWIVQWEWKRWLKSSSHAMGCFSECWLDTSGTVGVNHLPGGTQTWLAGTSVLFFPIKTSMYRKINPTCPHSSYVFPLNNINYYGFFPHVLILSEDYPCISQLWKWLLDHIGTRNSPPASPWNRNLNRKWLVASPVM